MDTWLDLNTVNLLGRVDSRIDKAKLIRKIARDYNLGSVKRFRQIHEGFEDFNIRLVTTKGTFLVKLFSQYKSFRHVKDNIQGLLSFIEAGVRVPKLYATKRGEYLYYYETKEAMALGCVMEYFAGKSFLKQKTEPTIAEMVDITKDIAKINSVSFKPLGIYDVWVVQNLPLEFEKKKRFLSKEDASLIASIVPRLEKIDYSRCAKGTIHNDIQRSNVLKNKKGEIRIIDFSVMEYHAVAIELATFLALFCTNPKKDSITQIRNIYQAVIEEYQKTKKLSVYDLEILQLLMAGTYGANCLAASYELRGKGGDSEETKYWISLGSEGMKLLFDNKL